MKSLLRQPTRLLLTFVLNAMLCGSWAYVSWLMNEDAHAREAQAAAKVVRAEACSPKAPAQRSHGQPRQCGTLPG